MKNRSFFILCALFLISCMQAQNSDKQKSVQLQTGGYDSFISVGEKFPAINILTAREMNGRYADLKVGDTIPVKFEAEVVSVCKKKGCWMNLKLVEDQEAAVKFKDYAFFVPKDIEEKEVVVNGKAFISVVSVEDQRHYAEDAGKTPEEIKAITEPKITLSFLADGVLIEQ